MLDTTDAYGLRFSYPARDITIGRCLSWHGEFGRVGLQWLTETATALEAGALIDVGCNVGALSLPLAKQLRTWRVIGVEAHAGLAGIYAGNAAENELSNVETLNVAVGAVAGRQDFPAPDIAEARNFGDLAFGQADAPLQSVRVATLDEIAPRDTRLVKIDIEGYEPAALAGAAGLLQHTRPLWLIETSRRKPDVARAVMQTMAAAGYSLHWLFIPFVVAAPLRPGRPPPSHLGDMNIVALPDGAPNVWELPALRSANEAWPSAARDLHYLRRFGY